MCIYLKYIYIYILLKKPIFELKKIQIINNKIFPRKLNLILYSISKKVTIRKVCFIGYIKTFVLEI